MKLSSLIGCARFSLFILLASFAGAQDIASFEKKITVTKLDNGLTVILMERPEAPVFSFDILVDAGAVQDPKGGTGLAHMFEHMAFKGTAEIGSTNWPKEKAALAKVEAAYLAYDKERRRIVGRDENRLKDLQKQWRDAEKIANDMVRRPAEFDEILSNAGAVGVNAGTGADQTSYFYSLPSSEIELWAYLESERFLRPVFREFYKERDVVLEERRMRTDSQPIGRLVEQLLATAFTTHPYHNGPVGWQSEISSVSSTQAGEFYKTYYTPANLVLSVVGDIKTAEMLPLIRKYFGRLPKGEKPQEISSIEPEQIAERSVIIRDPSQPIYLEAYKRPGYNDPDDAVYDAISDILSSGRTSRLYRSLVRDKKIALQAGGFSSFPGTKYPHLFIFLAVPTQGKTLTEQQTALRAEIERLKNEDVTDDELKMVKTKAKANLLRGLANNQGLANQLSYFQMRYGDWRELFRQVDHIDKVTKADIRRVSQKTFVPNKRTVGTLENVAQPKADAKGGN